MDFKIDSGYRESQKITCLTLSVLEWIRPLEYEIAQMLKPYRLTFSQFRILWGAYLITKDDLEITIEATQISARAGQDIRSIRIGIDHAISLNYMKCCDEKSYTKKFTLTKKGAQLVPVVLDNIENLDKAFVTK